MLVTTLISVGVGIALGAAYQVLASLLQMWASKKRATLLPAITVLGFLIRLILIAVILVVLGLWTPLNIMAVSLAFIVTFTILMGFQVYGMAKKRKKSESSTDTDGKS